MTSPSTIYPGITRTVYVLAVPLLLLVVLVPLLGAHPRSTTTTTAPAAQAVVAVSPAEQTYLDAARAQSVVGSDEAQLDTARNACADLNSGGDAGRVAYYVAQRASIDDAAARAVLRAAVHAYCPAHRV